MNQLKITKPVRLVELFSGIGTQAMAFERMGIPFEHYRTVEFDKYCVKSYNAIHGTNFETKDITQTHIEDLGIVDKEKFNYVLTYSFPCFAAGTLVTTDKGLIPIEEIKIGDIVQTHDGSWQRVIESGCTGEKELYQIRTMLGCKTECTINHQFYVRKKNRNWNNKRRSYNRIFDKPEFRSLQFLIDNDFRDYYCGLPVNNESKLPAWDGINMEWETYPGHPRKKHVNKISRILDLEDFWWIIGRYVADGWVRSQGGICIACNELEIDDFKTRAVNLNINISITHERTTERIHIPLKEFESFVQPFGRGVENKCIPGFVLDLPVNLLKAFLDGYFSGDGCWTEGVCKASSVSQKLILGIVQIIAKVYHRGAGVTFTKRPPTCVREGRIVNQKDTWNCQWKTLNDIQDKAFYEDGYIWFPIRGIESLNKVEKVYDITVENSHSFVANNQIVHNCQDLSVAGKMHGMEKNSGTRSSLLWEVARILEEARERERETSFHRFSSWRM